MDTSPDQLPLGDAFLASFERNKQAVDETAVVAAPRSAREADEANQLDQYFGELYKLPLPTLAARERSLADEAEKEAVGVLLDRKAEEKFAELSQAEGYENSVRWLAEQRRLGEIDDDFIDAAFVIVKEKARQPIPGVSLQDAWETVKASPVILYDLYKGVKGLAKYAPKAVVEGIRSIPALGGDRDRPTPAMDVMGASVLQGTAETGRLAIRLKRALFSDVSDYSEENLKKRLDSDLKFYEFVRAIESGEAFPDLTPEDVEYISSIGELTSLDNFFLPFGLGFKSVKKAAKVAAATELESKAVVKAAKTAQEAASVGTVRKATGDVVESVGKGMEKVAESPTARALGAAAGATAASGSPPVILMAAVAAASDAAESAAKRPGQMVQGIGQGIKKPLKPGSPSARLTEIMKETGTAAFYGAVGMVPFASIAEDPKERGMLFAGGGIYGGAGGGVAQVKNGIDSFGNSLWKPEEANDSVTRAPVTNYGSSLDATHAAYVNTLPASTANRIEALRTLVGQPMFTLDPAEYDAIVKTDSQGVTDIVLEDGTKAILVRGGSSALGHESGHSIFRSLPAETQQSIIDAVFKAYGPEGVADMKALYESSGINLKDDAAAVEEIIADNFQVLFNGGPLGQLGTPKGVAAAIYSSLGSLAERVGIRDLRPGGQVQTSETLKFTPSYLVQEALRTAVEAMNLDGYKAALEGTGGATPAQPGGGPSPAQAPVAPREGGGPVDDLAPPPRAAQRVAPPVDVGASVPVPAELVVDPQSPIRPKGVTGEADISQSAKDLLEEVDNGGRPSKATVERVARENGINTTSLTTLIAELQAKRVRAGAVLPQSPVEPATPDEAAPQQAPVEPATPEEAAPQQAPVQAPQQAPAQAPVEPATPEEAAPQQAPVQAPPRRPNVRVTSTQQNEFTEPSPEQVEINRAKLEEIANRPRSEQPFVEVDYLSAESAGTAPSADIRLEQRRLADAAEASTPDYKNPMRELFQKIFAPFRYLGGEKPRVFGFSYDKLIQNLDIMAGWLSEHPDVQIPYRSSSDPQIRTDIITYLRNQSNGYGGGGEKLVRPPDTRPGTITPENPDYTPVTLPREKVEFIGTLMGLALPKKANARNLYFKRFAEMNGLVPKETASGAFDPNSFRQQLIDAGFDPALLNAVVENLPIRRIAGEVVERPDIKMTAGDTAFTEAAFMPEGTAEPISTLRGRAQSLRLGAVITDYVKALVSADNATFMRELDATQTSLLSDIADYYRLPVDSSKGGRLGVLSAVRRELASQRKRAANRAAPQTAFMPDEKATERINRVRTGEEFGGTFFVNGGLDENPSIVVTLQSENIPAGTVTAERVQEFIDSLPEDLKNESLLRVGVFNMEGVPETSLDLNVALPKTSLERALAFGRANNQQSLWNGFKQDIEPTGGTGAARLKPEDIPSAIDYLAGRSEELPASLSEAFMPAEQTMESEGQRVFEMVGAPAFMPAGKVDSPEFKNWFGDSKVVDAEGTPRVVFHGAVSEFSVFDPNAVQGRDPKWSAIGSWFAGDEAYAKKFRGSFDAEGNLIEGPLKSVYLSLQDPAIYRADERAGNDGFSQLLRDYEQITGVKTNQATRETNNVFVDYLKDQGFDGIIIEQTKADLGLVPTPQDFYVAFNPTQIKSATGNVGTFDPNNPDIRYMPLEEAKLGEEQFSTRKKKGSLGGTQHLVHFSSIAAKTLNPKKMSGKGAATPTDLQGIPRAYFYRIGDSVYEAGIADRPYILGALVDGNAIYDLNSDPLGYIGMANREKADRMLVRAGFAGMRGKSGPIDMVAMFKPVKVVPLTKEDVYTPKQLRAQERKRGVLEDEDIDYQAQDAAWEIEREARWMPSFTNDYKNYWLAPDGKLIQSGVDHELTARRILKDERDDGDLTSNSQKLYSRGYKRVVSSGDQIFVNGAVKSLGALTKAQRDTLKQRAEGGQEVLDDSAQSFSPKVIYEAFKDGEAFMPEGETVLADESVRAPRRPLAEDDRPVEEKEFTPEMAAAFMPAAPKVDLENYIGRDVITITTDRLGIGEKEVGPRGAKRKLDREAQGGRGFPHLYTGLGWAFSSEGAASNFLTRLRATSEGDKALVATAVLGETNVLNSPFGQYAVAAAYRQAVNSGALKLKDVDKTIRLIFARAAKAAGGNPDMAKIKSLADYEAAAQKWPFTFGATKEIANRLDAAELKIPSEIRQALGLDALSIARDISDSELAGLPNYSLVSLMEIPVNQKAVKDDIHVSYPYSVTGKLIGFLRDPLKAEPLITTQRVRSKYGMQANPMMMVMPSIDALTPSETNPDPAQRLRDARLEYAR